MKYIDADRLRAEIKRQIRLEDLNFAALGGGGQTFCKNTLEWVLKRIDSLQHEQHIEGKQVIIIVETDGDANIHWDCRSLDDVESLLASAQSFITDKLVEILRGPGSGPDYNTTEGRFRNAHKFRQEQQEVDLEKILNLELPDMTIDDDLGLCTCDHFGNHSMTVDNIKEIARHFYNLGRNARKEKSK